jgi:hypothetical protein
VQALVHVAPSYESTAEPSPVVPLTHATRRSAFGIGHGEQSWKQSVSGASPQQVSPTHRPPMSRSETTSFTATGTRPPMM